MGEFTYYTKQFRELFSKDNYFVVPVGFQKKVLDIARAFFCCYNIWYNVTCMGRPISFSQEKRWIL